MFFCSPQNSGLSALDNTSRICMPRHWISPVLVTFVQSVCQFVVIIHFSWHLHMECIFHRKDFMCRQVYTVGTRSSRTVAPESLGVGSVTT